MDRARAGRAGLGRWWALGALTLAVLAVGLDATLLSVALPTLAKRLSASESELQWFSSGYLLALAAAMLPAGVLGDRHGRKRLLTIAIGTFALGSAGCAASKTASEFIVARLLLGAAGAGVVVMALAALTVLFSEQERPKAVGLWAAANFVALPIGPILGGWLLTHFWWGWAFLINVPVAVIGIIAVLAFVPESRAASPPRLDHVGMLTSVTGLVTLTYGLIHAGEHGWAHIASIAPIAVGSMLLIIFATWQGRLGQRSLGTAPLVDPALFASRAFVWGVALGALAGIAMIGVLFTLPQYFQGVRGTDAMSSGVRLLPLVAGLMFGAPAAERLARRLGAKIVVGVGFAVLAAGFWIGTATGIRSSGAFVLGWTAAVGVGLGLTFATCASAAVSQLPEEQSGVGAAVMQALQKTSGPFGSAILGSVISAGYISRLHITGLPPEVARTARESVFAATAVAARLGDRQLLNSARASFVNGMDHALLVSAALAVAGAALASVFLPARSANSLTAI